MDLKSADTVAICRGPVEVRTCKVATRYIWELYAASEYGRAGIVKPAESFAAGSDGEADALFVFRAPLFRDAPDGALIPIENEFAETDVRDDLRTCFSGQIVNDAEGAKQLFTELVDKGLTLSLDENGETLNESRSTHNRVRVVFRS